MQFAFSQYLRKIHLNIVARTATIIRRVLDWQLDLLDTLTVTLNYSVYTLQLTRAESSHLCLHWLPVFQHRRNCSHSEPTSTASLTELTELTLQFTYIAGEHGCAYCYVSLVTRHVMFTVPLPRARPPYCLQHARRNIIFPRYSRGLLPKISSHYNSLHISCFISKSSLPVTTVI
jgi:hypothetical protein